MKIRKLNELDANEILDFMYALSPAIPIIMKSEFLQMQFLGAFNNTIKTQHELIRKELVKEAGRQSTETLAGIESTINNEVAEMIIRDITMIIPALLKDCRNNVFEALAVLCGVSAGEVGKQPSTWLVKALWTVKNDMDLRDFLPSAGSAEQTESLSASQNSPAPSELTDF